MGKKANNGPQYPAKSKRKPDMNANSITSNGLKGIQSPHITSTPPSQLVDPPTAQAIKSEVTPASVNDLPHHPDANMQPDMPASDATTTVVAAIGILTEATTSSSDGSATSVPSSSVANDLNSSRNSLSTQVVNTGNLEVGIKVSPTDLAAAIPPFITLKGAHEFDIGSAQTGSILSFGAGFQLKVEANGSKHFQQKYSLSGKSSTKNLGKFPDISFVDAKALGVKIQQEVKLVRDKNSLAAFKVRIRKPKIKDQQYATFHSMEDIVKFLNILHEQSQNISREIHDAIELLIYIPAKPHRLLTALWSEFETNSGIDDWFIRPQKISTNDNTQHTSVAYLSGYVKVRLKEISQGKTDVKVRNNESIYPLFPSLFMMTENEREKKLKGIMQTLWPQYPIDLEGFRFFFKAMAHENSCFKSAFIDAMLAHKCSNNPNYISYKVQMYSIADWWNAELKFDNKSLLKQPGTWMRYVQAPQGGI